jgi:REP element-mobilizing transposase RayT
MIRLGFPAATQRRGVVEVGVGAELDRADIVSRLASTCLDCQTLVAALRMRSSPSARRQRSFEFRTWGGPRPGAGPKLRRERPAVSHRPRADLRPWQPVHVTLRLADHVWNLRSQRSFAILHRAVEGVRRRSDYRIVHITILGNHVHLLAEAESASALACGMRALTIRVARGLNRMMGRSGPVFEDRYFARAPL